MFDLLNYSFISFLAKYWLKFNRLRNTYLIFVIFWTPAPFSAQNLTPKDARHDICQMFYTSTVFKILNLFWFHGLHGWKFINKTELNRGTLPECKWFYTSAATDASDKYHVCLSKYSNKKVSCIKPDPENCSNCNNLYKLCIVQDYRWCLAWSSSPKHILK